MNKFLFSAAVLATGASAADEQCDCLRQDQFPSWTASFSGPVSASNSGISGSFSTCGAPPRPNLC